jgi:hypothetical protein
MSALTAEKTMARKKRSGGEPVPMTTVKITRALHSKLRIVSGVLGRDISDLLTELAQAPVDKLYKQALARLNKQAEEGD